MNNFLIEYINVIIPYIANFGLTLYPLWKTRDVKSRSVYIFVGCFMLYIIAGLFIIGQSRTFDLQIMQAFRIGASIPLMIMPYLVFRKRIGQNTFLLFVTAMYNAIPVGIGIFASENWFASAAYPLLYANAVALLIILITLPPLMYLLRKVCENPNIKHLRIWWFIWLLPATYFCLFLFSNNIINIETFRGNGFIIVRVLIYVALLLTCFILESSLRQVSETLKLREHTRVMENQLSLQRDQYRRMTKSVEEAKNIRHDMRFHLAAIGRLAEESGDGKVKGYIESLSGKVVSVSEKIYCVNHTVNAAAANYFGIAEKEGVTVEAQLNIPEDTGDVPAIDLCVILGNFLENALDACRRMESGNKFIHAHTVVDDESISIIVSNSFDGQWEQQDGVYLSRKENGGVKRIGVGLSSVKEICEKYGGLAIFEVTDNVWKSSALVETG